MSTAWGTRRFVVLGLAALAVSVLSIWVSRGMPWGFDRTEREGKATELESGNLAFKQLQDEVGTFNRRLEEIERAAGGADNLGGELGNLRERLAEIERLTQLVEIRAGREEKFFNLAADASAQYVSKSTEMVNFLSVLFVVVTIGMSLIASSQLRLISQDWNAQKARADQEIENVLDLGRQTKDRLEREVREIELRVETQKSWLFENLAAVEENRKMIDSELADIRGASVVYRKESEAGAAFLDELIAVHAEAFAEILSVVPLRRLLSASETQLILLKGQELRGRLLLLHPDPEKVMQGVLMLGAVGGNLARVDLDRLFERAKVAGNIDLALAVESVLRKIEGRTMVRRRSRKSE